MAFIVVFDACVLYPAPVRDLLVRLAQTSLFQAKWSDEILDECMRSILANRNDLSIDRLERTRKLMNEAVPDCIVNGYQSIVPSLTLPDPDDRHVLAACIRCRAQLLVTWNSKDFPEQIMAQFDIEVQDPDEFVLNLIDLDPGAVVRVVREQAEDLKQPPRMVSELLETLRRNGLIQTATALTPFV